MKLLYIVPGTGMGQAEMERRRRILQSSAGKDVQVDIDESDRGPTSIESSYEEYLSVPDLVTRAVQAEKEGSDGVILGCFGDPGIEAVREMVSIPVVGPGECSMVTAALLGHRFSIITIMDSVVASMENRAKIVGVHEKLASVRSVNIPVLKLANDPALAKGRMIEEARWARDLDRADVIVLGCMSMAFLGVSDEMQASLGIPVVNPAVVSLKILEGLIAAKLSHSKKAFPFPPKFGRPT